MVILLIFLKYKVFQTLMADFSKMPSLDLAENNIFLNLRYYTNKTQVGLFTGELNYTSSL